MRSRAGSGLGVGQNDKKSGVSAKIPKSRGYPQKIEKKTSRSGPKRDLAKTRSRAASGWGAFEKNKKSGASAKMCRNPIGIRKKSKMDLDGAS